MADKTETTPKKLTAKQFAFCKWYCSKDCFGNAYESAKRAGYKGSYTTLATTGRDNLQKPHIKAEIDRMMDEATSGANITIERVLADIDRRGRQAEESGNPSAALKASELQGKYLKMWVDRIEHVQNLDEITDEQLQALINELTERLGVDILAAIAGNGAQDGALSRPAGSQATH